MMRRSRIRAAGAAPLLTDRAARLADLPTVQAEGRAAERGPRHGISVMAWGCAGLVHVALAATSVGLHGAARLPVPPTVIAVAFVVSSDDAQSAARLGADAPKLAASPDAAGSSAPRGASPATSTPASASSPEPVKPPDSMAAGLTETDEFPGAQGHAILPLPADLAKPEPPPSARSRSAAAPRQATPAARRHAASPARSLAPHAPRPTDPPPAEATGVPPPDSTAPSAPTAQDAGPASRGQQQAAAVPMVPPRPLSAAAANPKPDYPAEARNRRLQGRVLLRVDVSADGLPMAVTVSASSGHAILDAAAITAVRRWRFNPATRAGVAIEASAYVPILFRLED
jgi:protein TonB